MCDVFNVVMPFDIVLFNQRAHAELFCVKAMLDGVRWAHL